MIRLGLGMLLAAFSAASFAEPIQKIVIQGIVHVQEKEIREVIETRPGDDFASSIVRQQIRDDIRAVWALGFFQDVSSEMSGSDLIFKVVEKNIVHDLQYAGNKKFKKKKLDEEVGFDKKSRLFFSPEAAENYKKKIQDWYTKKSFPNSKVSWTVASVSAPQAVDIVFAIDEGKKMPVKKVVFEGNTILTDKALKKTIQTKESWWFIIQRQYDETAAKQDIDLITLAYWNVGYLDVKVTLAPVEELEKGLRIKFLIEEGLPYTLGDFEVEGNTIFSREELLSKIQMKPGDLFSYSSLRDQELAMIQLYLAQGYLDTSITPLREQLQKDEANKIVDIRLRLTESTRKYMGKVEIEGVVTLDDSSIFPTKEGEFKTKDFVILREIELKEGDPLDWSKVLESDRNLVNLNFFKTRPYPVKGQPNLIPGFQREQTNDPDIENLRLQLEETQTGSLSFGGGISTSYGPSVFATLTERNIFGYGIRGSIQGEYGKYRNSAILNLFEPHLLNSDYSADWDIYYINQEGYRGRRFDQERIGSSIMFGKELDDELSVLFGVKGEVADIQPYRSSRYSLDKSSFPEVFKLGETTTTSLTVGVVHDARDFKLDPTAGTYGRATLEVAGLTDNEFVKFRSVGNYFKQIFNKPVLAFSGELNLAYAYGSPGFIPLQERFFIGGANSIRGFDEGSIGESTIIWYEDHSLGGYRTFLGGEAAFVGNTELRYPLTPFLQAVAFVDMGSVWPEIGEIDPADFRFSAGAGFRFRVPGLNAMIRVDFAAPIRKLDEDETEFFHFSFGQSF
ncbi:MAG: outer membrane protein assembly factor BamA [Candidatus Omnitrophota bacterium]